MDYMATSHACSPENMTEQKAPNHRAGMVVKQPMRAFADICIRDLFLQKFQASLLWWAKKRKDFLQMCCRKLHIRPASIDEMQVVLHLLQIGPHPGATDGSYPESEDHEDICSLPGQNE
jgi:hypothetical protein